MKSGPIPQSGCFTDPVTPSYVFDFGLRAALAYFILEAALSKSEHREIVATY